MNKDRFLARNHYAIDRAPSYRRPTMNPKDKTMFSVPVPVEQRFSKEFNCLPNGRPASDIHRLIDSSSALEIQQIVNRMVSTQENRNSQKLTVEQKFLTAKPRWVDTPTERERFMNYVYDSTGLSENDLWTMSSDNQDKDGTKVQEPASSQQTSQD